MQLKPIKVESLADGTSAPAKLVVCDCGEQVFIAYFVSHDDKQTSHLHLQCAACDKSYCQPDVRQTPFELN